MKIVIAGAGEVGTHLSKMLSREKHDIIIMDPVEEHLAFTRSGIEVMSIIGNATSLSDLEKAGVKKADLFISVMPDEANNITASILASNIGAEKTIARINNYEYLLPKNKELFERLGIHSMIYPEMLAAKEIVAAVKRPWARQYWELFGGALIMVAVKVMEGAPIVNQRLIDLFLNKVKTYHLVAIKRSHDLMIIPKGDEMVKSGDLLFITTTAKYLEEVRILAGKERPEIKSVIIMGGGHIAVRACQYLPSNVRVKIVEIDRDKCYLLASKVPSNVLIINGDARDTELLMQEDIRDTDAFIALTENSSTNMLACLAAKRFGVYKSVAQIENLDYVPLAEKMDIGSIINKKQLAASHIYQYLLEVDVTNVKCLAIANANVAELIAHPKSRITKRKVRDLRLPVDMTLGGLVRNNVPMMIEGETQIQPDDRVMVFCFDSAMRKLKHYFN